MSIDAVPNEIKHLTKLKYLNITFNKSLTTLPNWLHELSLTHLCCNDNELTDIPSILPTTLKILKLHNNKIRRLNPMLSLLDNFIDVSVHGNPLIFPELAIVQADTQLLLKYLHEFLSDTEPNITLKLAIIGKERVGKTALINALVSTAGVVDDSVPIEKTDGLEIHELDLAKDIKLKVFDLAGDIDYFETHSIFLSDNTLYLAVFDVRSYALYATQHDFLSRVETWLSSIYSQTRNSRVILVGTHADTEIATTTLLDNVWNNIYSVILKSRDQHVESFTDDHLKSCLLCCSKKLKRVSTEGYAGYVVAATDDGSQEDISKNNAETFTIASHCFPHIVGYYEVSNLRQLPKKLFSSKNLSIIQLKKHIISCGKDILSLHPSIPRKWIYINNILKEHVEKDFPVILYREALTEINKYGLDESDFQLFLRYYQSTGEIIFSGNSDYVILDPIWLSNQLRIIITYKNTPEIREGLLSHRHLKLLFNDISSERQQIVMSIFRQAGIFIPLDDINELIPCKLLLGSPDNDQWPSHCHKNEVNYLFQCQFLPPSFFPHLIALSCKEMSRKNVNQMKPLYLSNNVVYVTDIEGVPCDVHATVSNEVNILNEANSTSSVIAGLNLYEFLKMSNTEELFRAHRDSIRISTLVNDNLDVVEINNVPPYMFYHRVRFQLLPYKNAIVVSIRGPRPCCIAPNICDYFNRVSAAYFVGLKSRFFLLCNTCVRASHPHPSYFKFKEIRTHLPVCSKGHDLISWNDLLTGKCPSANTLTVSNILSTLNDYSCPKLFLLLPVNLHSSDFKRFITLSYLKEGFAVHLLCEATDGWHFLKSPGYRLNRPKEFIKKYGKRLKSLLNVIASLEIPLKIVGGLFQQFSGIADTMGSLRDLAETIGTHITDFADDWDFKEHSNYANSLKYLHSNDGLKRKEFARFLNKTDEDKRFGDLIPTFIGDKVSWLCETHHKLHSKN